MNREIAEINNRIHADAIKEHLIVLSNMESLNAEMIKREISREDRQVELNPVAKEHIHR